MFPDSFPLIDQPWLMLAVFLIVLAASVVQAGLGMGFGLTAAPLLALIDPHLVPVPTLILGMVTAGMGAWRQHVSINWPAGVSSTHLTLLTIIPVYSSVATFISLLNIS